MTHTPSIVPTRADVQQEDADLGVLDPASGSGVLALNSNGECSFFKITGLVNDQDTVGVAEPVCDEVSHVVTNRVGIPLRPVQQPLHRIRAVMPGLLGHLPARFDLQFGQQPGDEPGRRPARLHPGKPARETTDHFIGYLRPAGRVYALTSGHRKIRRFVHNRLKIMRWPSCSRQPQP